jgi:hypothetical protein
MLSLLRDCAKRKAESIVDNSLPPTVANTEALADVIGQRKLAVKTILGAHSPQAITMADVRLALDHRTRLGSDPGKAMKEKGKLVAESDK